MLFLVMKKIYKDYLENMLKVLYKKNNFLTNINLYS